jgi:hypothetical protein
MGVRTVGELAARRRSAPATPQQAAAAAPPGAAPEPAGLGSLEQAVPTEIIAFYTAIIAACETVLAHDPRDTYTPFRLAVFLAGFLITAVVVLRQLLPAVHSPGRAVLSPEWWVACLSFAAWGVALPGSFLYTWLSANPLTITVATVTAAATLMIGVFLAPSLKNKAPAAGEGQAGQLELVPVPQPGAPGN